MADLTKEQQQAKAKAAARLRLQKLEPPNLATRGLTAALEGLATIGTGTLGSILGGVRSIPFAATQGNDVAVEKLQELSQGLTFEPRTELGRQIVGPIMGAMRHGTQFIQDKIAGPPSPLGFPVGGLGIEDPLTATAIQTTLEGVGSLVGFKRVRLTPNQLTTKQNISIAARDAGLTIPPGSTRGGAAVAESLAGRAKIRAEAASRNIPVYRQLANKALGRAPDEPITVPNLEAYRVDKGAAYQVIDDVGNIALDAKYRQGVANAVKDIKGASREFPSVREGFIDELINISNDMASAAKIARNLDSQSVRGMIGVLRDKADEAFRGGHTEVGRAYRQLSKQLEDAIERDLGRKGSAELVDDFRDARRDIAKSYSVQEALVGDDIINPANLKAQAKRGVPLTDELLLMAKANEQFPQSTLVSPVTIEGPQPLSVVDALTAIGGAGASIANPAMAPLALLPLGRLGTRSALLTGRGQALGVPKISNRVPAGLLGTGTLANSLLQTSPEPR